MNWTNRNESGSQAGWISITDLLLLTTVLLLALSVHWSAIARRVPPEARGNAKAFIDALQWKVADANERSKRSAARTDQAEADLASAKMGAEEEKRRMDAFDEKLIAAQKELNRLTAKSARTEQVLRDATERLMAKEAQLREQADAMARAEKEANSLRPFRDKAAQLQRELDALTGLQKELVDAREKLSRAEAENRQAGDKAALAGAEAAKARAEAKAQVEGEGRFRQELLGLDGSVSRVVFVVDRSGSMSRDRRWKQVQEIVTVWMKHLPVRQAGLVIFDDSVQTFPSGKLKDIVSDDDRTELVRQISELKPRGDTNTYAALEAAYRYSPIDAIVLFTDGQPNRGPSEGGDHAAAIFSLIKKQKRAGNMPRIHTIGLGSYLDESYGEFLRELASSTGGTFIGR